MEWTTAILILVIALGTNIPLGLWRSRLRKRSPKWFVSIHLGIPLLIFLRIYWDLPLAVIPAEVVAVLLGQVAGARLRPGLERRQALRDASAGD